MVFSCKARDLSFVLGFLKHWAGCERLCEVTKEDFEEAMKILFWRHGL